MRHCSWRMPSNKLRRKTEAPASTNIYAVYWGQMQHTSQIPSGARGRFAAEGDLDIPAGSCWMSLGGPRCPALAYCNTPQMQSLQAIHDASMTDMQPKETGTYHQAHAGCLWAALRCPAVCRRPHPTDTPSPRCRWPGALTWPSCPGTHSRRPPQDGPASQPW